MAGFGEGLGGFIGGELGAQDLKSGLANVNDTSASATGGVNNIAGRFMGSTEPYNTFGQAYLPGAGTAIGGVSNAANNTQGYSQFMSTYTNTPAAQYQLQQADQAQENSAAARGGLLSGQNERALATINNGIVSQNANTAYNEYLAGNQQQFGQLEAALGNMFHAIGVGQTATGQDAGIASSQIGANASLASAQMGAQSSLAQAQAKNDQSKGSGIGSMFGGLSSLAFGF